LSEYEAKYDFKSQHLVREGVEAKVMRENKPVLLVPSVYDREIILEKGENLSILHTLGEANVAELRRPFQKSL
jgi:hypothetical protein